MFFVRDLASGATLAAVAVRSEKARAACAVLLSLFALFGAPLVLKMDNGSAFRADLTQALLEEHAVMPLRSPPYVPQYNGSCERSIGCFKQRVDHIAMIEGHAGRWLPRNLDDALLVANTTARPFGANGPTPAEAFEQRRAVTMEERKAFKQSRARAFASRLQTFKEENGRMPTCSQRAALDRKAMQKALCDLGYLEIRRGRISTPVSTWRADINT